MNNIKKVLSAWMLVACVLPVAAQYPVIPDSVKARGAKQEAELYSVMWVISIWIWPIVIMWKNRGCVGVVT